MASQAFLQPSPSQRKRFSREGFQPIPAEHFANGAPNDATIDIPLEHVQTTTSTAYGGYRSQNGAPSIRPSPSNASRKTQKTGLFRGRRAKTDPRRGGAGRIGTDGEEDHVTTMGKIYKTIYSFSIITRYFLYVLPLGLVFAVPIIVGAIIEEADPQRTPMLAGVPLVWFFTWIEIVWLSLWVSKIVAHFLPYVFQAFVGVVSSGVRKYATVIEKLEIPLSLVGWALTSLATFIPVMTHAHAGQYKWETIVQEVLAAALISSLVFLGEKFIIQMISINYHRKQFNEKIKDSKRHVFILDVLFNASRAMFPAYCHEFEEEDYIIADQMQLAMLAGRRKGVHHRTGSSTPMRLMQDLGRFGGKVSSAFGNVAHEITGKDVFNSTSTHSIVIEALEKKRPSEALARRIWMSFVVEGKENLTQEDLVDVLGDDRKAEAEEAFWYLDRDGNGDVSLEEMILTVVEWGRERKSIASSMVDVAQAINVLDNLLMTVVFIAVVFIFIAFLNKSFVTTLATTGTALLSLSFVFSVTAQEILGSCIFLFVKHPFDIGDRVDIANDQYVVEHISLLFCVFRRVVGPKTGQFCQYPNIVLNTLALENITRSKAMTEHIHLDISFDTSFADIQILKNELSNFVNNSSNSRDFQPDLEVEVLGTTDMSKLQLKVEIKHKSNWSNETLRAARRSKFMCALVAALRVVPIYAPGGGTDAAGSAANPNYSVAISDLDAKANAKASAQSREDKRMVSHSVLQEATDLPSPLSPAIADKKVMTGLSYHEARMVNKLTARDPASEAARDEAWASGREDLSERVGSITNELDDVRSLLKRENTLGKRRPGAGSVNRRTTQDPSIPTIREPKPAVTHESQLGLPGPVTTATASYSTVPTAYQSPAQQLLDYQSQAPPYSSLAQDTGISEVGFNDPYTSAGADNRHPIPPLDTTKEEEEEEGEGEEPESYSYGGLQHTLSGHERRQV